MALVTDNPESETPAESLAREARNRLAELAKTMLIVYGNLVNYQFNNAHGVTSEQFTKALGKDAKDFASVTRAMKRMLLKLNPDLKEQLNAMVPKKTKAAKKPSK